MKKRVNKTKTTVLRTSKEDGTTEVVLLEYAVDKLQGFWRPESIVPMLLDGQILWNFFYTYQIQTGAER